MAHVNIMTWVESVARDTRLGIRSLRRQPAFTSIAVLTLAVALGSVTTIFALLNWYLLRPVASVADPQSLVVIRFERMPGDGTGIAEANARDLGAAASSLLGLAAWQGSTTNLQARLAGVAPFIVRGTVVQGDYFGLLGLTPRLGRLLAGHEATAAGPDDLVVVSERFWRTYLRADERAIGAQLVLNAQPFVIVGVAPEGFHGTERTSDADVWLPPASYPRLQHRLIELSGRGRQASIYFELIGRLTPRATRDVAQGQLRAAMARLVTVDPEANAAFRDNLPTVYSGIGLPVLAREATSRTLTQLLWGVAVLLGMSIANFANLLLVRGAGRQVETSVRQALGATRGRIFQQSVIEAMIIVLAAGACGLAFALTLSQRFEGQSLLGLPLRILPSTGESWPLPSRWRCSRASRPVLSRRS